MSSIFATTSRRSCSKTATTAPRQPAFRKLNQDLAVRYGPRDDRVLCCRRQEATCLALLGDTGQAIRLLRSLLADEM